MRPLHGWSLSGRMLISICSPLALDLVAAGRRAVGPPAEPAAMPQAGERTEARQPYRRARGWLSLRTALVREQLQQLAATELEEAGRAARQLYPPRRAPARPAD